MPMKKTLVIAVWNDESSLPALFKVLTAALKKDPMEILFVDSSSQDGSLKLCQEFAAKQKSARVLQEEKPGYANAYNRGLVEATGEAILFLDGETLPEANWSLELASALNENDIAVGLTESNLNKRPDPFAKTMAALFKGRSARSAAAQGFALPWGAATNLIARREWF
ncbi:MAG: glycosyltransferase family 2 protein, partial [Proteobacteria bacterium]